MGFQNQLKKKPSFIKWWLFQFRSPQNKIGTIGVWCFYILVLYMMFKTYEPRYLIHFLIGGAVVTIATGGLTYLQYLTYKKTFR